MNIWQFHFLSWWGVGPMQSISIFFFFFFNTKLLVWAFPQSHRLNFTYCLKSFLLLACVNGWANSNMFFIHLTIRTVSGDRSNIERLKGGPWSPELWGRPKLEGGSDLKKGPQTPLYTMFLWKSLTNFSW